MVRKLCASATVIAALAAAPALAQTKDSQTKDSQNSVQGSGGNLSSKLSQSGGVIKPKGDVDPDMHVPAPAPHPNSTPVIPPSATGGNNAK